MNWYVLYTKPRTELKIAELLTKAGIECYCPSRIELRQWSDRKKKVRTPLFNSIVFVRLEEKDRHLAFVNNHVVRYLFWLGKPAIVRDCEINTLKAWMENKTRQVDVQIFKVGEKVKVVSGVFKDINARVAQQKGDALTLVLESIGYKVWLSSQNCVAIVNKAWRQSA